MQAVILTIHLLLALALILVVLLQRSEGGGLGMGGGGGGVMTSRGAATALSKVTWVIGIAFVVTSLTLTIIAARDAGGGSVIDRARRRRPASRADAPARAGPRGRPAAAVAGRRGDPAASDRRRRRRTLLRRRRRPRTDRPHRRRCSSAATATSGCPAPIDPQDLARDALPPPRSFPYRLSPVKPRHSQNDN